jgi:hypothetical protein
MIHPDTELRFINDVVGFGVVATKVIPKGTIVWVNDHLNQVFTATQMKKLDVLYRDTLYKYCYRNAGGDYVLEWDIGRYINHSFKPNCISTAYDLDLAIRDISSGEELTEDYGFLNPDVDEPFEPAPEEGITRRKVVPQDFLNYFLEWDDQLKDAFKYFNLVEQPLKRFVWKKARSMVDAVANGEREMDSILNLSSYSGGDLAHLTKFRDKYVLNRKQSKRKSASSSRRLARKR